MAYRISRFCLARAALLVVALCVTYPSIVFAQTTPNNPAAYALAVLPIGSTTVTGNGANISPTPLFTIAVNLTGTTVPVAACNQPHTTGGAPGPIILGTNRSQLLIGWDDPVNKGQDCTVDLWPVFATKFAALPPGAYPNALQAIDASNQASTWGFDTNSFQQPGPPPAAPTNLRFIR